MKAVAAEFHHASVLVEEVATYLEPRPGRLYCDCTVGGGGHAWTILDRSGPDSRLIGIDRDPSALAAAAHRLAGFVDRVTLVHGAFGDIGELLAARGVQQGGGFLLGLGVRSPQSAGPDRGVRFRRRGAIG